MRKTRILESIFFAKQEPITRTSFVYKTSQLVRICLLISALNKGVLLFFLEKLFIKAIENFFPVFAYPDITTQGVWENSRQLCKPEMKLRVCITVENSPNPSHVYIRLCKQETHFLLLNCGMCMLSHESL